MHSKNYISLKNQKSLCDIWLIIVTMMLEIQPEQENDYENPSSNAESEDENDLPEDWILKSSRGVIYLFISLISS